MGNGIDIARARNQEFLRRGVHPTLEATGGPGLFDKYMAAKGADIKDAFVRAEKGDTNGLQDILIGIGGTLKFRQMQAENLGIFVHGVTEALKDSRRLMNPGSY